MPSSFNPRDPEHLPQGRRTQLPPSGQLFRHLQEVVPAQIAQARQEIVARQSEPTRRAAVERYLGGLANKDSQGLAVQPHPMPVQIGGADEMRVSLIYQFPKEFIIHSSLHAEGSPFAFESDIISPVPPAELDGDYNLIVSSEAPVEAVNGYAYGKFNRPTWRQTRTNIQANGNVVHQLAPHETLSVFGALQQFGLRPNIDEQYDLDDVSLGAF